jgi:cytochrome c oxidase subunit 2
MIVIALLQGRGIQSALEPAGRHAAEIGHLWNLFLGVTAVIYVLVMIALLLAIVHKRRMEPDEPERQRSALKAVSIATGISVIILFSLLISSIFTTRGIANEQTPGQTQMILTGHQWWWQIEYDNVDQSKRFQTANELTLPVHTPINIHLRSSDVIHSFWVPNLNGKRDLIPRRDATINLNADRVGVYRGQCAEFCGQQHAKMAFWVNVVSPGDYDRWLHAQEAPSRIPSTSSQRKGMDVFMNSPCPLCHTIRGTNASGSTAPDLTHFASRRSIAAATVPNRRGFLAGWILDPQHLKPGNNMPPMVMEQGDLEPLLDYLESLQ